jgi:hypothetical protein
MRRHVRLRTVATKRGTPAVTSASRSCSSGQGKVGGLLLEGSTHRFRGEVVEVKQEVVG